MPCCCRGKRGRQGEQGIPGTNGSNGLPGAPGGPGVQFGSVINAQLDPVSTWLTAGGDGLTLPSGVFPVLPVAGTGLYVLPTQVKKVDVTAAVTLTAALPGPPDNVLPLILQFWSPDESSTVSIPVNVPLVAASPIAATGIVLNVSLILPLGIPAGWHVGVRYNGVTGNLLDVAVGAVVFLHFHN